jgi:hypothetical protein
LTIGAWPLTASRPSQPPLRVPGLGGAAILDDARAGRPAFCTPPASAMRATAGPQLIRRVL